ncbi:MAG: HigA family addiction module antitoxin [Novosphingobium sp.]
MGWNRGCCNCHRNPVTVTHFAVHPGRWLREEIVDPHGLSVTDLARHIGVSRQAVSMLLNGRTGLTAEMAIRFEKAFGLNADTLCRMQTAHELAGARERQDDISVARWQEAA